MAVEVARASVSDASGTSPWGGVPGMPHRKEAPGQTQEMLERLCLLAGLGTPRGPSRRDGGTVWGEEDEFKLIGPSGKEEYHHSAVTLSCHLSPEISAVDLEIRWFQETACVCVHKNREVTEGRGYEGRVSLFTQQLDRGIISLQLRDCNWLDEGCYRCQVTDGDRPEEITVEIGGAFSWRLPHAFLGLLFVYDLDCYPLLLVSPLGYNCCWFIDPGLFIDFRICFSPLDYTVWIIALSLLNSPPVPDFIYCSSPIASPAYGSSYFRLQSDLRYRILRLPWIQQSCTRSSCDKERLSAPIKIRWRRCKTNYAVRALPHRGIHQQHTVSHPG
ncbi:hypothetical protein QTP86_000831 [Hemibagrus guttatus]|nr:hypothetical protein QTP86_000831 [Hemibagrus guttatus]